MYRYAAVVQAVTRDADGVENATVCEVQSPVMHNWLNDAAWHHLAVSMDGGNVLTGVGSAVVGLYTLNSVVP